MSVYAFTEWSRSLVYAGYAVTQFGANLIGGGPVIQSFLQSIENLSQSVLSYSSKAFATATENEIGRLAAGGAISNSFDKKIDFDDGLTLFDELKKKLALSAASLPGNTEEYITVFRSLSDDMAVALNNATAGGEELKGLFKDKVPKAVETLVLQSKLYGQDIPVSSITRTYSKLLSTGTVNSREIFVQRNPVLRTGIAKWEKDNAKKLPQLNVRERFEALNKIFADSISAQQMAGLTNSFQAKIEEFKSFVFNPSVGLFGFEREYQNAQGETTTLFKTLSKAIGPVIDGFTHIARNVTTYGDPVQAGGNFFDETVTPALSDFNLRLQDVNRVLQVTEGDFKTKLRAALKAGFNFDYVTFDYSGAIDAFFKALIKGINTFGDNIKPDSEVGESMTALLSGLFGVLDAVIRRITKQVMTYPKETAQFLILTNPSLVMQGFIALAAISMVLAPIFGLLGNMLGAVLAPLKAWFATLAAGTAATVGIVVAILAFLAAIIIFRDQLKLAGAAFTDMGDQMTGPFKTAFQALGFTLTMLGNAGQSLTDSFNKLVAGDWRGAIGDLLKGLGEAITGVIAGLGTGVMFAWEGLYPQLLRFGDWLIRGLGNLIFGTDKNTSIQGRTSAMTGAKEVKTGFPLYDIPANILNTSNQFWRPGSNPLFKAEGNSLGNLLYAIQMENKLKPTGAQVVIANSSEAIIPAKKVGQLMAPFKKSNLPTIPQRNTPTFIPPKFDTTFDGLGTNVSQVTGPSSSLQVNSSSRDNSSSLGNVTVNVYVTGTNSTGPEIADEVRKCLVSLLE